MKDPTVKFIINYCESILIGFDICNERDAKNNNRLKKEIGLNYSVVMNQFLGYPTLAFY